MSMSVPPFGLQERRLALGAGVASTLRGGTRLTHYNQTDYTVVVWIASTCSDLVLCIVGHTALFCSTASLAQQRGAIVIVALRVCPVFDGLPTPTELRS